MRKRGKRYKAAAKDLPSGSVSLTEAVKKINLFRRPNSTRVSIASYGSV